MTAYHDSHDKYQRYIYRILMDFAPILDPLSYPCFQVKQHNEILHYYMNQAARSVCFNMQKTEGPCRPSYCLILSHPPTACFKRTGSNEGSKTSSTFSNRTALPGTMHHNDWDLSRYKIHSCSEKWNVVQHCPWSRYLGHLLYHAPTGWKNKTML